MIDITQFDVSPSPAACGVDAVIRVVVLFSGPRRAEGSRDARRLSDGPLPTLEITWGLHAAAILGSVGRI